MKKTLTLFVSFFLGLALVLALPCFSYASDYRDKGGGELLGANQPYADQHYIAPKGKLKIGNPISLNQPLATTKSSSEVLITWTKNSTAQGYMVQQYKNKRWITIKTIPLHNKCSYTVRKLKRAAFYKFRILAYSLKKGKRVITRCGVPVSAVTKEASTQKNSYKNTNSKCNATGVTVSNTSISIKHLTSKKVRAKAIKPKGAKKNIVDTSVEYFSTNQKVAKVSDNGTITGIRTGKCTVYAIAHNGKKKAITVYVTPNSEVNATEIPIFTFHRIVNDKIKNAYYSDNEWVESVSAFEAQLKYLSKHSYKTITLKEFDDWYHGRKTVSENSVVLTFDDGNYETYYLVYPLLKKYNMTATVFVIGSRALSTTPKFENNATNHYLGRDIIKQWTENPYLNAQSHSWGLHSYKDGTRMIYWKNREELKADFSKMKQEFGFEYMAFPYGHYTNYVDEIMPETGIKLAFAFGSSDYARKSDNPYQIRRIKITEYTSMQELTNWLMRY